jgi:hypothetical protein
MASSGRWIRRGSTLVLLEAKPTGEYGELETGFEAQEYEGAGSQPTLRRGSKGLAVTDLQRRLKSLGIDPGPPNGNFGPQTEAAVRAFQQSRGIAADGIVGPQTWGQLSGEAGGPKSANPYYSEFVTAASKVGVPTSWASNPSLLELVKHESSWNPAAKNPRSSAFGLFQFITSTWKSYLPEVAYGSKDPTWQAVGGYRYIKAAYSTPERAWAFWQATVRKNPSLAPANLQSKARTWVSHGWGGY